MVTASQITDLEARFSQILQPIRDLTRNWDVDIAHYLEEYLEDLDKVVVTFNSGQTTMNFAEAALLIQGSACVYSKKVEYLYSLVYQVLDMVVNKKKQHRPTSVDAEGNDADADFPPDDKEEFLLLDDTKGAKPEKLQNHDDPDKECQVQPLTPMNLIAQEEGEKGDSEINNVKGELLGNLGDFQMNCSSVQPQGGVFLDLNLLPFLHSPLRLLASSTPFPHHVKPQLEKTSDSDGQISGAVDEAMDAPPVELSMGDEGDHGFDPIENEPQAEKPPEDVLPKRSERKVRFAVQKPKPAVDHWAMPDPFSAGKLPEKKLKVGRTFKLPPGIERTGGAKKRKRRLPEKKALTPISEFVQMRVYSHRPKFPKNPCMVPSFPEFDDLFWKEFKRRQEMKRQKQKQQVVQEVVEEAAEDGEELVEQDNWPAGGDEAEDDDNEGADNFEPLQLQLEDNMFAPVEAFGGDFINSIASGSSGSVASTYEELVRRHVENFLASAAKYAQISELSKRVAEWEEKITPRLLEEEQREPFDIHVYGTTVLESLHKGQSVPFRRIVGGKPVFQICRLFLATLQLANVYNVDLTCPGQLAEGMDKLQVRLLSKKRHYEELAEYQAPSLAAT